MAVPTPDILERLGRLLEAGTLRVPLQNTYGLDQAGEGLRALGTAHTQGKLAISGNLSALRSGCSPGRCPFLSPGLRSLSWTNFRELRKGEVRRMILPRTWVNKGLTLA
jgi:Zinc-binding dehydrogenase